MIVMGNDSGGGFFKAGATNDCASSLEVSRSLLLSTYSSKKESRFLLESTVAVLHEVRATQPYDPVQDPKMRVQYETYHQSSTALSLNRSAQQQQGDANARKELHGDGVKLML